jgi:hypothetical protein
MWARPLHGAWVALALACLPWAAAAQTAPPGSAAASVAQVVQAAHARAMDRVSALHSKELATLREFGAMGDGKANDGPALRRALASGRPLRWEAGTYLVAPDPASAMRDGRSERHAWSLRIPSNALIVADAGAVIKQAPGAQAWTRTVSLQGASNVSILGTLAVDANVAQAGQVTNEHMHGVFLFDTQSTYIEAIESRNARGDNVFVGGSGESVFSRDLVIGRIAALAAGRKNLVLHYAQVVVGSATLDNSNGGAMLYGGRADSTDRHSLDVEPDDYTGRQPFLQRLGRVVTSGSGNDFTAGTSPAQADNFVVQIDDLQSTIVSGTPSIRPWEQNGITIECGSLSIRGVDGASATSRLAYAGRLRAGTFTIHGSTAPSGYLMMIATAGSPEQSPRLEVENLSVSNSGGNGLDIRTAHVKVSTLTAQTTGLALRFGENAAVAAGVKPIRIDRLITRDSGDGAIVAISTFSGWAPDIVIGEHLVQDRRARKAARLYTIGTGLSRGFVVRTLVNPDLVANK